MNLLRTFRAKMAALLMVMLVIIAGQGGIGAFNINRMYLASESMFETNLKAFNAVTDILHGFRSAHAELLLALQHAPDSKWAPKHDHPVDKHLSKAANDMDDVKSAIGSFKRINVDGETKTLANQIAERYTTYEAAAEEAIKAIKDGAYDKANEIVLTKLNPAVNGIAEAGTNLELTLLKTAGMQNEQSKQTLKQVLIATGIGVLLAIGISGVVGTWLGLNIGNQIKQLNAAFEKISAGDLTGEIRPRGQSEFDHMLERLGAMQSSLSDMMRKIKASAELVAAAAEETTLATRDAVARSEALLGKVIESSTAMEEMTGAIAEVSNSVSGVDGASSDVTALSKEGVAEMNNNLNAVQTIVGSVDETSNVINTLSESTKKISELAAFIREIADQTNLLALNAAIEAARAGEHGRGFAVVADEVRKLAEKTTASSDDIAHVIKTVNKGAEQAVEAMGKVMAEVKGGAASSETASEKLGRIMEAATHVSRLTHQIANAAAEQTAGAQETARNMEQVSAITEENNAVIKKIGISAASLANVATELQVSVSQFRLV